MWIFRPEKLHQKRTRKQQGFYDHQNYIEKSTSKKNLNILTSKITQKKVRGKYVDNFDQWDYVKKSRWKQHGFFDQRNCTEKSTWKQREFFDHRKMYVETTWIFQSAKLYQKIHVNDVEIRQNLVLDISTLIRCVLPVG